MNKELVEEYFAKILKYRTQTSYKFYLLLSIFEFGDKVDEVPFVSCGREMIVQAWEDLSDSRYKYSKPDKLMDFKVIAMSETKIPEFCSKEEIRRKLLSFETEKLINCYKSLTNYCVHCLLSYGQWNKFLKGAYTYHERLPIMETLSKEDSCLYEINGNKIILNSDFFETINKDKEYFKQLVRKELERYLLR